MRKPRRLADPHSLWPDLREWQSVGTTESVWRVQIGGATIAYVRPDDGSAPLLRRLVRDTDLPVPRVLDRRWGWLLLSHLPGVPLHRPYWREHAGAAAVIVADVLRDLDTLRLAHGDLCLPNILGDPTTGKLTGIVDWGDAERYEREMDVAAAVWSCGFNEFPQEAVLALLERYGWSRVEAVELDRLCALWKQHAARVDLSSSRHC